MACFALRDYWFVCNAWCTVTRKEAKVVYYTSKPSDCFKILTKKPPDCWPFHLHLSYISRNALSCFLNSFGSKPLRSPSRPPVFISEICQHFRTPCHCRRFTLGFHLYSFVEDSESTAELCHVCGVKNCYNILWPICRYTATSLPEVAHALR